MILTGLQIKLRNIFKLRRLRTTEKFTYRSEARDRGGYNSLLLIWKVVH